MRAVGDMRAARYCYVVVWCVVVGDSVRPGRGDGMEQVKSKWAERAKSSPEYMKRMVSAMVFNKAHGISNSMYAGMIGVNNRKYLEDLL